VVEARELFGACTRLEDAAARGAADAATEAWPRCAAAIAELLGPAS
jgi:DNA-binding GntR family transcriptional regulator